MSISGPPRRAGSGPLRSLAGRLRYRASQFAKGLLGPSRQDDTLALAILPSSLRPLYRNMNGYGRRHAVDVLRSLQQQGWQDPALFQAALLHDIGKGNQPLLLRVAVVLIEQLAPRLIPRLGSKPSGPWGFLYRDRMHAQVSADLVVLAGGDPEVAEIIAAHYDRDPADPRIQALQAVDDRQ